MHEYVAGVLRALDPYRVDAAARSSLRVAYTAMHGVGLAFAERRVEDR